MSFMNEKIKEIEDIINKINFKNIYPYFEKQKIGVYEDRLLHLSEGTVSFISEVRASTKEYSTYTILNHDFLSDNNNINAGLFVRQMLINSFYKHHDKRIPNDLIGLRYPRIFLNYDYMNYERYLIVKAMNAKDNYVKLNYFRMFLNVRDLRRQMIGNEFSMQEYNLETIEGLATYLMYKVVLQLDKNLAKTYLKESLKEFNHITKASFDFFNVNKEVGFFMALIMDDLGLDIGLLYEGSDTLYQLATNKIKFIREPISYRSDRTLINKLEKYESSISEKFSIFFENNPKRVQGPFQIFAYDPKRIFVDKDNLYHESFVILKNLLNNELIRLNGPVITKVLDNSIDIVTSYHYFEYAKKNKKR